MRTTSRPKSKVGWVGLGLVLLALIALLPGGAAQRAPDLAVTDDDLSFSQLDPVEFEDFTVYARVTNGGDDIGDARVDFYFDREILFEAGYLGSVNITVGAGLDELPSMVLNLPRGNHTISVDVLDVSPPDTDMSNNFANATIEVFPPGQPPPPTPSLLLTGASATIAEGAEEIVTLNVTALGGNVTGVSLKVLDSDGVGAEPVDAPFPLDVGVTAPAQVRITVPDLQPGDPLEREIRIQATGDLVMGNTAVVSLTIEPAPPPPPDDGPTRVAVTVTGLAVLGGALGVLAGAEWGRYWFLGLMIPLYTKLRKDQVLDQYTRGKIHGYLVANPGTHFNAIGRALELSTGQVAYHLQVLEREGHLVSRRDGSLRRFYPPGAKVDPSENNGLSLAQKAIFEAVRDTPGIRGKEVAALINVTPSTVSYHLDKLVARGLVRAERKGMSVRYTAVSEPQD